MNLPTLFLVGLGGFVGTIARYGTGFLVTASGGWSFLSTLIVNVLGSFAIGWVLGFGSGRWEQDYLTIITVGVLGGFTTFSAFSAETILFFKAGQPLQAFTYAFAMLLLGFAATYLGFVVSNA